MTIKYFLYKFSLHKKLNHSTYHKCKKIYSVIVRLKKEAIDDYFKICFIQMDKPDYFPNFVLENREFYRIFLNELKFLSLPINIRFSEKSLKILMYSDQIFKITIIPEYFIDKYKDRFNWQKLTPHLQLTIDTLTKYRGYVDWKYISRYCTLTEEIVKQFTCNIVWTELIRINNTSGIKFYHKNCCIKFPNNSIMDISKYLSNPQDYIPHSYYDYDDNDEDNDDNDDNDEDNEDNDDNDDNDEDNDDND